MAEIEWRDVVDVPGYQVSACGQVRSVDRLVPCIDGRIKRLRGKTLSLRGSSAGYWTAQLSRGVQRLVHRLVAEAFIGPSEGRWVNHKNGNKKDNRVENLEWCSPSDNMRHAVATGLTPKPPLKRGVDQHKARLNEEKVRQIRTEYANGAGIARLARQYGVGESTVRNVIQGNSWAWLA